jgi:hypothetical protein
MDTQTLEAPVLNVPEMLERFYQEPFFFSYSSMNLLLFSPNSFFNQYVLKKKEEKLGKYLIDGKVIHCLLLNDGSFDDMFIVSPGKVPEGNNKMVVEKIFRDYQTGIKTGMLDPLINYTLSDFKNEIISYLAQINLHQSLVDDKKADKDGVMKTGDEKRLERVLTPDNISYFEFKRKAMGRDVIDQEQLAFCTRAAEKISRVDKIRMLMGMDVSVFDNVEVINEQEIRCDLKNHPFGLKGFLDNLVIDHETKKIRINDVKTTNKSIADFRESIEYFNYWLQAIIYIALVMSKYKNLHEQGYAVEFHFIVIDTNHHVYAFPVSEQTLDVWYERFSKLLEKVVYHYSERKYELPYEFCRGEVVL